jgi:hypothetical protein
MTTLNPDLVNKAYTNEQTLLVANRNEKYFLGDRKTFMKELQDKINTITKDMVNPDVESMSIDGEFIEDKNSPGALFLINTKLNELKDLNRTIVSTFDFLKETEKEVSRMISS